MHFEGSDMNKTEFVAAVAEAEGTAIEMIAVPF